MAESPESPASGNFPTLLEGLKALAPVVFEHLVFDLLFLLGLRNLVWRSPGADGGRDIEGDYPTMDFAGASLVEHWYVECKRYAESLSWPLVREKLAFAENHRAHALLICTTAQLSPQCKDEARRYQERRALPYLRFWDAGELENRVAVSQPVLAKYRLDVREQVLAQAVLPLIHESNKVVQASYALQLQAEPSAASELAAAMVELAEVSLSTFGTLRAPQRFRLERDIYAWCEVDPNSRVDVFSSAGLRAMLCALRYLAGSAVRLEISPGDEQNTLIVRPVFPSGTALRDGSITRVIALWGDMEVTGDDWRRELRARNAEGY